MSGTVVRRLLLALVGLYWVAIFTATHLPRLPEAVDLSQVSDKTLHYAAYGGLGFLLSAWWMSTWGWSWSAAAKVLVIAAVYGVLDELLQIPVNRHADAADWWADVLGTVTGIAIASVVWGLMVRTRRR